MVRRPGVISRRQRHHHMLEFLIPDHRRKAGNPLLQWHCQADKDHRPVRHEGGSLALGLEYHELLPRHRQ